MKSIKIIITPEGWNIDKEGYSELEVIAILDLLKLGLVEQFSQQSDTDNNSLPNYQNNAQS